MTDGQRHSDRIVLAISLRVFGIDPSGREFEKDGRTLTLNRHGARIQLHHALNSGQIIRILNPASKQEALFRVIGPVAPYTESGGEWGVACLDPAGNIWGVQFPPLEESEKREFKALLECKKCHTRALLPVSLVEVEVLDTAGIISKSCARCLGDSSWGYVGTHPASYARSGDDNAPTGSALVPEEPAPPHPRPGSVPVSALIRDYCGFSEITRSEDVSPEGFSFSSGKDYLVGQGILATCPYDSRSTKAETHARIVHRREDAETHRRIYVVRYEARSEEFGPSTESTQADSQV